MKITTPSFLTILYLLCVGPLANVEAVSPPPDGGYPNGNTAEGQEALLSLVTGSFNTAVGWRSLESVTTGELNTGVGAGTLVFNTADGNTAIGAGALLSNTIGFGNTANGSFALFSNTIGDNNTAVGREALFTNTAGESNVAIGRGALANSTTGVSNLALGIDAGNQVITASNVIAIGHTAADVSDTTWISNVFGVTTQSSTTAPVIVSDTGQLGTVASSERFKKDIATMEKASEAILALRPVTFQYKTDTKGTPQFGLIAEEVAKVNPALVLPDKEGKPYTVRYDAVNAMLLNEFLKEHLIVQEQGVTIAQQQEEIKALKAGLKAQAVQIQKVSAQLQLSKPEPQTALNNP